MYYPECRGDTQTCLNSFDANFMLDIIFFQFSSHLLVGVRLDHPQEPEACPPDRSSGADVIKHVFFVTHTPAKYARQ